MEDKTLRVIVTDNFEKQAESQYGYIYNNSPQNADKFADGILPAIIKISKHPQAYSQETIISTTKNIYRFMLYMKSWKIIYKVTSKLIVILGIVSVKQHPKAIEKLRTNEYK